MIIVAILTNLRLLKCNATAPSPSASMVLMDDNEIYVHKSDNDYNIAVGVVIIILHSVFFQRTDRTKIYTKTGNL